MGGMNESQSGSFPHLCYPGEGETVRGTLRGPQPHLSDTEAKLMSLVPTQQQQPSPPPLPWGKGMGSPSWECMEPFPGSPGGWGFAPALVCLEV